MAKDARHQPGQHKQGAFKFPHPGTESTPMVRGRKKLGIISRLLGKKKT